MSGDVAILWDAEQLAADWQLQPGGNLATATPIETAVLVSLFTDAPAKPDDVLPPGETDRRGWWGDQLGDEPIGSRLWLLRRAKHLPETLRLARDYIREALAWLVTDEVAAAVDVTTDWASPSRMLFTVVVRRADGTHETVTASWAWQGS